MKKIFLIVVVFFGIGVYLLNKPNKGRLNYLPAKVETATVVGKQKFVGEDFGFEYWSGYKVEKKSDNVYQLLGPSGSSEVWTISLIKNMSVDENSGVIMRRIKKDDYNEIKEGDGVIFKKEKEKIFFENKKTNLLIVAASNLDDENKFGEMIKSILIFN